MIGKLDEVYLFINHYGCGRDRIILLAKDIFDELVINFLPTPKDNPIPDKWLDRCLKSNWPAVQVGMHTLIRSTTLEEGHVWFHSTGINTLPDDFYLKEHLEAVKGIPIDLIVEHNSIIGNPESLFRIKLMLKN